MTNGPGEGDNVTRLDAVRDAYKNATPHKPKGDKKGGGKPPEPPNGRPEPPLVLPPDSPVQALGVNGRDYYFLNAREQFQVLKDTDITMNPILGLFGNSAYLRALWPRYDKNGKHVINFDHGMLREVLIYSCHLKGIWSPEDNVRGVGAWAEDDGTLVLHRGDQLFLSSGMNVRPGLRDRTLYPAAPGLPHPSVSRAGPGGPGETLLAKLQTWNWDRGEVDAKLYLGHLICSKLGAAQPERPVAFITGASGCGKSKLAKLKRWIMSRNGVIRSEDATEAYIRQKVGNTSLPVSVDEAESEGDERSSKRLRAIIKLARLAFTGAEMGRGQPGGQAQTFTGRNTFEFSAIVKPSLPEQDVNRMFVGQLGKIEWDGAKAKGREPGDDWTEEDEDEEEAEDTVLGSRLEWERIGQQLDYLILSQWKRYRKTLRAFKRALENAGHKARGQDQFGALGAAYDLVMFDDDDTRRGYLVRSAAWAEMLPAGSMAETSGYVSTHEACLKFLMGATVDGHRGGMRITIAQLLLDAWQEIDGNLNDRASARQLEQLGIKLFRDKRDAAGKAWWIAVAHISPGLSKIYRESDWQGIAGAPGAWAQMLQRLPGNMCKGEGGKPLRLRFTRQPEYCTAIPWETAFPARGADDEDNDLVDNRDRNEGPSQLGL